MISVTLYSKEELDEYLNWELRPQKGEYDFVVDGADAVEAGNDVVMPGGPPVIAQVLKGYGEGRVSLDKMKEAVAHLMNFVMKSKSFEDKIK